MKKQNKKQNVHSDERPPVFVVGYMHSGTTLLINIIKSHSSVFSGEGESKYFMHQPMIRRTFPDLDDDRTLRNLVAYIVSGIRSGFRLNGDGKDTESDFSRSGDDPPDWDIFLNEARKNRDYGAIFALVCDHLTRAAGKTRWVEKTPTHIFHIDEICEAVPDALFVEIVRDPRDVLASKKTRKRSVWNSDRYRPSDRRRKHWEKAFDPVWDSLSWKSAVRAGMAARKEYGDRIYTLRYEDLVAEPEDHIRKICDFLQMEFEPSMLDVSGQNAAEKYDHTAAQTGIVKTSVGRWKTVLKKEEVAVCQWQAGKEMNDLGYRTTAIAARDKLKTGRIAVRSLFEFVERSYGRWRLGGCRFFQNIFINYWRKVRILLSR
jgi:hypothetical protein